MALQLYQLKVEKDRELSPFVWRARLALAHKGLTPDLVDIGYGEKHRIAFSGQDRVPVLVEGATVVDRTMGGGQVRLYFHAMVRHALVIIWVE